MMVIHLAVRQICRALIDVRCHVACRRKSTGVSSRVESDICAISRVRETRLYTLLPLGSRNQHTNAVTMALLHETSHKNASLSFVEDTNLGFQVQYRFLQKPYRSQQYKDFEILPVAEDLVLHRACRFQAALAVATLLVVMMMMMMISYEMALPCMCIYVVGFTMFAC